MNDAQSKPVESLEVERKYAVQDPAALPAAAAFAGLGLILEAPIDLALEARYFDTPSGDLAAQRVAVRSRRGGTDDGWHVKERTPEGVRELHWPDDTAMPAGLLAELAARLGADTAARVAVIATLRTTRTVRLLRGADGEAVVELADDRVDATNDLSGRRQRWREWEAELLSGAEPAILDRIEPLLVAAGAERVRGTSKIQRAMSPEG